MSILVSERLAHLDHYTLDAGAHQTFERGHCALELVAWLAGEDHTDHPACTSPVIAAFVREWNDGLPDADRTRLLRPILPRLIGTVGTDATERLREWMIADWFIRVSTPAWLDLVPALHAYAAALRALPAITGPVQCDAVLPILSSARDATRDATRDAAWDAADVAARAAAGVAASAATWDATRDAARDAAWDAARDAARAAAGVAASSRLALTVESLQGDALVLIDRLIDIRA